MKSKQNPNGMTGMKHKIRDVGMSRSTFFLAIIFALSMLQYTPYPSNNTFQATTLPIDGDAWTENDNATYTWVCVTCLDTIEFAADDAKVGSYSLRVNHTSSTGYMKFRLDLGSQNDVATYDYVSLYIKWTSLVAGCQWRFKISNNVYYADSFTKTQWQFTNNTWLKVVIPKKAFILEKSGIAAVMTWDRIQYLDFDMYSGGLCNNDGSTIHVDGLKFGTYSSVSVVNGLNALGLPNYFAFLSKYAEKPVTLGTASYTSLYDFINITDSTDKTVSDVESEVLGLTLVPLCIAYEKTEDPQVLEKINTYASWLSRLANENTPYGGIYRYFIDSLDSFCDKAGIVHVGWALSGLSYAYHVTGNPAYSDACHRARTWFCEHMWDASNRWYDNAMNLTDGTITPTTFTSMGMGEGATVMGLASYYRFVSQDSTAKSQLDAYLSTIASSTASGVNNTFATHGEGTGYTHMGFWQAYKAFNNNTYLKWFKQIWEVQQAQYEIRPDGTCIDCLHKFYDDAQDRQQEAGWSTAVRLLDLMLLYEEDRQIATKLLYENAMFDSFQEVLRLRATGLDQWAIDRWNDYGETPSCAQAMIYASLVLYKYNIAGVPDPFILSTDKLVNTSSFDGADRLKFTATASSGQTSTTNVYCGSRGKPTSIEGATSWSYDETTNIESIAVSHSSTQTVTIEWIPLSASGGCTRKSIIQ